MKLKSLFALLIMHRHNLQMIHWNVVGKHFTDVHETLNDYVDHVTGDIDKVAEMIKMLNINETIPTLPEALDIIEHDEHQYKMIDVQRIESKDAWNNIGQIFNDIIASCQDAYNEVPSDIQSELDSMMYYYRIEANYKCKARLVD